MYRSALVLLTVVATLVHGSVMKARVPELDGRIVGGEDTTIEKYPYQLSLRAYGSHICGASIIGRKVAVTAAHCVNPSLRTGPYSVQYGTTILGGDDNVYSVERFIRHDNYDSWNFENDIALLFVYNDFPFSSTTQPTPVASKEPAPGTLADVTGWGALWEGGPSSKILQEVQVDIYSNGDCNAKYGGGITDGMICAGKNGGGKDACQGDSGGPLTVDGQLVGIVSWGYGCARPGYPGVYTRAAYYRSWIAENST